MTEPQADRARSEPQLVDWRRLGRRMGLTAAVLLALALVAWGLTGRPGYLGLAFAGLFLAELVFVGGSALRGLIRAGEEGERLAGNDVGLLPTQVRRRLSRQRDRG